MNALLISLILCIPFILVGTITGIIYFISGYKRGLYRSLFSLGITVVSILLSILLANILAAVISGPVLSIIPADSMESSFGVFSNFAGSMLQGIIKVALAFILFVILLFISLIVLKLVGNRIKWEKLDMKDPDDKKLKLAGMGVRAVDTLLVTFMLLLPLYGTLSAVPLSFTSYSGASNVTAEGEKNVIIEETSSPVQSMVDAINNHPLVNAYKIGPANWAMRGLSNMGSDLGNVNAIEVSDVLSEATGLLSQISFLDGDAKFKALNNLCILLKEEVVCEKWCYTLVCSAKEALEKQLNSIEVTDADIAEIRTYLDMLDMSREDFETNAVALLDFVTYATNNSFDKFYESSDFTALSEDFYKELGTLLNSSKQAISLKKIFYVKAAEDLYIDPDYEINANNSFSTDVEYDNSAERKAFAQEYVNSNFGNGKVKKADFAREGESFMLAFFSNSYSESVDAFVRHPLFGAKCLKPHIDSSVAISKSDISDSLFYGDTDFFIDNEKINSYLHNGLEIFEDMSVTEGRYSSYMKTVFNVICYTETTSPFGLYVNADNKALEVLLAQAKNDKLGNSYLYDVLCAIYEFGKADKNDNDLICVSDVLQLINHGKDTSLWPDRVVTLEECGELISYFDEEGNHIKEYEKPEIYAIYIKVVNLTDTVKRIVASESCTKFLSYITETMGTAPYGIGETITDKEKAIFEQICENVYNDEYIDSSKIDYSLEGSSTIGSQIVIGGESISGSTNNDGFTIEYDGSSVANTQGGTIISVNPNMPYGYCYDWDEYGRPILRPLSEEEIAENNDSLKEGISIIKAFMGF